MKKLFSVFTAFLYNWQRPVKEGKITYEQTKDMYRCILKMKPATAVNDLPVPCTAKFELIFADNQSLLNRWKKNPLIWQNRVLAAEW